MLNTLKRTSIKLSLVAALAIIPTASQAASASGFIEGSSESTKALIEPANFEAQLNRINVGINLVRLNTVILEQMPVSEDSEWVEQVVTDMTEEMYTQVQNLDAVKNDAYYSTVLLTDTILQRPSLPMSLLNARLFWEANVLYDGKIPNMNVFPDISNMKTYVTFQKEDGVKLIKVEAKNGNLYNNVEEATISLLPEDLIEDVNSAKGEYKVAKEEAAVATAEVKAIEAWLDDDANEGSPDKASKEEELKTAEAASEAADKVFDEKEEIYFNLLAKGAEAIAANFDETKIPLAKKLEKLLDTVDNNAVGAISMFTSSILGIQKGLGMLDKELQALQQAQALTNLVGNQKEFMSERLARMGKGALLALPNIGIGTYYASKQISLAGEYQQIVNKVLEGAKALEEEKAAQEEAAAEAK